MVNATASATAVVSDGRGDGDDRGGGVSEDRVYLNDLVAETVGDTNDQVRVFGSLEPLHLLKRYWGLRALGEGGR